MGGIHEKIKNNEILREGIDRPQLTTISILYIYIYIYIIEGSLEVKLPTIWTDEKQSRAEAERRDRLEERRVERERVRRKKMQMREKVGKSRNTVFFQ